MIHLFLVDPHPAIRLGVREILRGTGLELAGEASGAHEACLMIPRFNPDVLVTELTLPGEDAVGFLGRVTPLLAAPIPIVVYAAADLPTSMARLGPFSVQDYILKSSPPQLLVEAIRAAVTGESPIRDGELGRFQATPKNHRAPAAPHALTAREMQVLRQVASGLSNKEIGKLLDISVETVKEHVQNILRKTGVSDRTQAAVWGVRQGLID